MCVWFINILYNCQLLYYEWESANSLDNMLWSCGIIMLIRFVYEWSYYLIL